MGGVRKLPAVDYPLTPTLSWSTTLAGADVGGLHLRPASRLAQAAGRYRADIQIECGGLRADAKSVLSILVLAATPGALLRFTAQGDDAAAALAAMREVLAPGAGVLAVPTARPPDHLQRPGADPASARCSSLALPEAPMILASEAADAEPVVVTPEGPSRGRETILLAEDETSIRLTSRMFPEALGYTVLAAETPEEAMRLAGSHSGPIHLLITDVIMPGMNGPDLAALLAQPRPDLKCLVISGYTAEVLKARGALNEGMPFLSKPFSRHDLARKVREVLDA